MGQAHYGDGGEVKALAGKLVTCLGDIRDLTGTADKFLKVMQASVRDHSYQEVETIVREVQSSLLSGLDDAQEVHQKLHKYGDYLESLG